MIKNFNEYVNETMSIKNGLQQNPKRQTEELLKFNEVLPDVIDRISQELGISCFADYKCYPYEEHVFASIGCVDENGKDNRYFDSVEFSELDDPDSIVNRIVDKYSK